MVWTQSVKNRFLDKTEKVIFCFKCEFTKPALGFLVSPYIYIYIYICGMSNLIRDFVILWSE